MPGHLQPDLGGRPAVRARAVDVRAVPEGEVAQDEPRTALDEADVAHLHGGRGVGPVGQHPAAELVAAPGQGGRPGVVGAGDERAVVAEAVGEPLERLDHLLGRAVVVEVVGLHVGDDRDLGGVDEEGGVGLVGLGDEDLAAALVPVRPRPHQLAAQRERGVEAGLLQQHGEHRRRRGLAVGPGHRDRAVPEQQRLQRLGPVQHGGAALAGPASSTLSWRIAEEATTVRTPSRRAGSKPTSARAPTARSAAITGTSFASLPETSSPRASMIRAMPDIPMPPMPRKCTRRQLVGRRDLRVEVERRGHDAPARPDARGLVHQVGQTLVGVEHRGAAGGVTHGRQATGVGEQRDDRGPQPVGGQVGVVDEQPAPGRHHGLGVEPLLAVADRQRHVDGGEADGGDLADRARTRPAQHQIGCGVGEVHPVGCTRAPRSGPRPLAVQQVRRPPCRHR